MPERPDPPAAPASPVAERVARLLGARPREWGVVRGGDTAAARWIVRFGGGRSAFMKLGTDAETAAGLRVEWSVYSQVSAPFLPAVLGWDDADGDAPLLLLEDLSAAYWPPPWLPGQIERVLALLDQVAATRPPPGLIALESLRAGLGGWPFVAADPAPFLALGLCSATWLEAALPALIEAEATAPLGGESLLHLDVRSANLCFSGERVVLLDWSYACRGNPRMDVAFWLPNLHGEGGPEPDEILPGEPGLAALLSGFWAARAGLPPPTPGSPLRRARRRYLGVAFPWAARALGLPPPDGRGANRSSPGGGRSDSGAGAAPLPPRERSAS